MPRPRVHDEALRATLLTVTSRLLADRGPDQLTVRAAAAAAGTSTSAVYGLFGSRDDLLREVAAEAERRFAAHLGAVPVTDDPAADLLALGVAYRRSALRDPHFYRVVFGPNPTGWVAPGAGTEQRATFSMLLAGVRRCADAGLLRPDEPLAVASTLWAAVHGMVSLELAGLLPDGPPGADGPPGTDAAPGMHATAGTPGGRRSADERYAAGLQRIWTGVGRPAPS